MSRAVTTLLLLVALMASIEPGRAAAPDCPRCHGTGWIDCPLCRQKGEMWCSRCASERGFCPRCRNTGHVRCPDCAFAPRQGEPGDTRGRLRNDPWSAAAKVHTKLILIEDASLRLATDLPHKQAHEFFNVARRARAEFRRQFRLRRGETLWQGRCTVYLFKDRETYIKFALDVDGAPLMAQTEAYSRPTRSNPLVVIARGELRNDDVYRAAIHELAHVFLELYRSDEKMPTWLSEGVAQWFEFQHKPRGSRQAAARKLVKTALSVRAQPRLEDFLNRHIDPYDDVGYAIAWSFTSFLVKYDARGFRRFVDLLKDGVAHRQAFDRAFGAPLEKLERYWHRYIRAAY